MLPLINYQILIYNIINNSQIIIENATFKNTQDYSISSFRILNNIFLPNAIVCLISDIRHLFFELM